MNPRTTGILFLVAVLLGGLIWWSNRHEVQRKDTEEQAKRLFGDLQADQVEWIALRTSDGHDARIERKDGAWRLTRPIDFPADATTADGIASALAGLTSEGVIEDAQDFAVYGLDQDEKVLRFRANGVDHELRMGKKTPVGANDYAATGPSGTVYTVPSYRATSLAKPLDDLRERRPLRFDRDGIARIELTWHDGGVVLEKSAGREAPGPPDHQAGAWKLVAPLDTDADSETVETLLSDLVFLRASGFVDQPPPDAEVGLDKPQYRAVLIDASEDGKEPLRHELVIGGVLDAQTRAARGAERALYKIPTERFDKLPKQVVAFRFKTLAQFIATDAQRFEISYADAKAQGSSQVVTVTGTSADGEGWTVQPREMAPGLASRLVAELARLRADDIAAEKMGPEELAGVGLAPPRATVRVFGKAPAEGSDAPVLAEVRLGIQKNGRLFAQVPSRETVYLLSDALAEHLPLSFEAYENRFVAKESPAAAAPPPADTEPPGPADAGEVPGDTP